jgi:signal peptidase I
MYLCRAFKKNSKLIYILYFICAIVAYRVLGTHQDGRLALIWVLFIILAMIHAFEELASRYYKRYNNFYVYLGFSILIILLLVYIFTNPIQLYVSTTPSMTPTIYPKNIMLINKTAYRSKQPQRNDIVLFKVDSSIVPLIHRIIACSNDTVTIKDRTVTVNGEKIEFDALNTAMPGTVTLSKGQYYHKGDNPNSYSDVIYSDQILGKLIYTLGGKPK